MNQTRFLQIYCRWKQIGYLIKLLYHVTILRKLDLKMPKVAF